jgi:hypothetical protein
MRVEMQVRYLHLDPSLCEIEWLTTRKGYPKLREHLGSVVAIMKLSSDWHDFRAKLDRLHPPYGKPTQLSLEFADDEERDTGKGL